MGYMVVYSSMRMIIRQQTFAKLSAYPDAALTAITISKTSRDFMFKGRNMREVRADGKMYDIVRQKDNGSSITYYCLRDHKEEQMILKAGLINDQSKSTNPLAKTSRLILDQIIKTALIAEKQSSQEYATGNISFHSKHHIYSRPSLPVPAPPPQPIF